MRSNRSSWLIVLALISLMFAATGCGGGSNPGTGTGTTNPPTVKSVTVNAVATMNVGDKQPLTCSLGMSDGTTVNTGSCTYTSSATSVASVDTSNNLVANAAGTTNVTASNSGVTSSPVTVTVSQPAGVTGVSVNPTSASISDVQPLTFTFTVSAVGMATTANLSVSPATAGTLSATSNVASGSQVTFTPAGTGAGSATITVTSTADSTKSAAIDVTITVRTITLSSVTPQINWMSDCAGLLLINVSQTGIMKGDSLHTFPYPVDTATQTPPSTFTATLGIGNDPTTPNPDGTTTTCSPGAYDFYVTGTDGATSNHQYVLIASPHDQWAGYDSTDEYVADFGNNQICKYSLKDGSSDGCFGFDGGSTGLGLKLVVDSPYILSMESTGVSVFDALTGKSLGGNTKGGDVPLDFSVANHIIGHVGPHYVSGSSSPASEEVVFVREGSDSAVDSTPTIYTIATGIPTLIRMTKDCMSGSNTATAAVYDSQALAVRRYDVTAPATGAMTVDDSKGSVAMPFANSTQVPDTTVPRHLVVTPGSCRAVMTGPVIDGSAASGYDVVAVVIDLAAMKVLGMTTVASQPIPATAMELTADPAGNAVVVDSADTKAGNSPVERISWNVDSLGTLTFNAAQQYTGGSPTGVYGVALGILPNGTVSVGQRGTVSHLAPSTLAPLSLQ